MLDVECQLKPDARKVYSWPEYLTAARRLHQAIGRVLVLSPVDNVIVWAHNAFADERGLLPLLIGREHVPRRRGALTLALELRGLVATPAEQALIDDCDDPDLIERWCERAKSATTVAELFDHDV